jgi:hypothetical protein
VSGLITAITPVKRGAQLDWLATMAAGLSWNERFKEWIVAVDDDSQAEDIERIAHKLAISLTINVADYGSNVARKRNRCLEFVTSRYFVQADADDIYVAGALDYLAIQLDREPGAGGAFGACVDFDHDTNEQLFRTPHEWMDFPGGIAWPGDLAERRHEMMSDHFPVPSYPPHPGAGLFATDTLPITGGYPTLHGGNLWEDVEHLGRVNRQFPVLMFPDQTVMHYRKHPASLTAQAPSPAQWQNVRTRLRALETGSTR